MILLAWLVEPGLLGDCWA